MGTIPAPEVRSNRSLGEFLIPPALVALAVCSPSLGWRGTQGAGWILGDPRRCSSPCASGHPLPPRSPCAAPGTRWAAPAAPCSGSRYPTCRNAAFSSPRPAPCHPAAPAPLPLAGWHFPQIIRHHLRIVAPIRPANGHHQRTKSLLVAVSSRVAVAAALGGCRVSGRAERRLRGSPKGPASLLPPFGAAGCREPPCPCAAVAAKIPGARAP